MAFGSSPSVIAALERRNVSVEISDNAREITDQVVLTMQQRVTLATQHVFNRVTQNISTPVTKTPTARVRDTSKCGGGPIGSQYTKITDRSQAGEFPRADTTQLLKTLLQDVYIGEDGVVEGAIGTPLDYGLILETQMERSFLVRTLTEEMDEVQRILGGPIA